MTSLLDVLFILVFAALTYAVQARNAAGKATQTTPRPSQSLSPLEPSPTPEVLEARRKHQRAIDTLLSQVRSLSPVHVGVSATGVIERIGDGDEVNGSVTEIPLVAPAADPNVRLIYLGNAQPARRVCNVVAAQLPGRTLANTLVIIELSGPVTELPVALVNGLRQDQERCAREHAATAVLLER
jgi:hypothetical protein